ncbi:uncharacterized protein LOC142068208 [Phalacrocorax aristotelis]|uniref:uncharacterized protein LOC142068208 n=1 Tax=Phalacrocorax aristotelis TaxID=126867 RepID=UPI003F4B1851
MLMTVLLKGADGRTSDSTAQLHTASTGKIQNYCLDQKGRSARLKFSHHRRKKGNTAAGPSRAALPGRPSPADPGPRKAPVLPRRSPRRRALRNCPPGRHRDGPSAGSPARRQPDERPLHLLPLVPIPVPAGPAHGAPSSALPAPRGSRRQNREDRGAGRSPSSQRARAVLRPPRRRAAQPGISHQSGRARARLSRTLSPQRRRGARPAARASRLIHAVPRPPPPQGAGPAGPRGAGGWVRAWRRAAAGPEQAASLERPAGLPLPQAAKLANRRSLSSPTPGTRAGVVPSALLTEACERREPRSKGRTAAKPETDTAAILGPELCGGGRGRERGTARGGRGS